MGVDTSLQFRLLHQPDPPSGRRFESCRGTHRTARAWRDRPIANRGSKFRVRVDDRRRLSRAAGASSRWLICSGAERARIDEHLPTDRPDLDVRYRMRGRTIGS
jgi:hypothetical protein